MPFVEKKQAVIGFRIQKRIGRPMLCGWAWCGWSQCGEEIEWCGVYQQRRPRIGNGIAGPIIFGKQKNFFQAPTWPVNTITEASTAWRLTFAEAVEAWQSLTLEQKQLYNIKAIKKNRHGYNYFISEYLKSH
jgi:hypothetical protein